MQWQDRETNVYIVNNQDAPEVNLPNAVNPLGNAPVATRQQMNGLRYGAEYDVAYAQPEVQVIQNVNPNPHKVAANPINATQVFGHGRAWQKWPEPVDNRHLEMHTNIEEVLLYRVNPNVGIKQESAKTRIITPSVTQPPSTARFYDGRAGDVY